MSAQNTSHGQTATLSKKSPSDRGRDGRKTAQDDDSTGASNSLDASQGNPPNHGVPTHGSARFLWQVPKDTPLSQLGELYERWRDDTQQVDLGEWSE